MWKFWKKPAPGGTPSKKRSSTPKQKPIVNNRRVALRLWKIEQRNSQYIFARKTIKDRVRNFMFGKKKVSQKRMRQYEESVKVRANRDDVECFDLEEKDNLT